MEKKKEEKKGFSNGPRVSNKKKGGPYPGPVDANVDCPMVKQQGG